MLTTTLLPWLHYLGLILLSGGIVAEMYLLKLDPREDVVRLLPRVDRFYFIGVLLILISGLARMSGKGMAYYLHNGAFHGVLTLFVIAALVSLPPTFRFIKWRKALNASGVLPDAAAWAGTRKFIHIQTALIAVIALLMVLTARGIGA
ncbi:MAG: DUF2214 family protein [Panacagrimonas sp.]